MAKFGGAMELNQVKGLGAATVEKLKAAGIKDSRALAGLDLRKHVEVPGVSREALQSYKARARKELEAAGMAVPKAPYRKAAKPARAPKKTIKRAAAAKKAAKPPGKRAAKKSTAKTAPRKAAKKTTEQRPEASVPPRPEPAAAKKRRGVLGRLFGR